MIVMCKSQKGFTLIESAIVIMILSFVLIPLFHFLNEQETQRQEYQSERKKERIIAALDQYFKINKRYPCPSGNVGVYTATFGQEGACGAGVVSSGLLPVGALELPWEYAANNRGYRYLYTVTRALTTGPSGNGAITIQDASGSSFATNVHYVVVDSGNDGKGARSIFGANGPALCGTTALDSENCNGDSTFVDAPISIVADINNGSYYDDTVMYSLSSENNAMWIVKQSGSSDTKLDIINRNDGMIGIGFSDATGNIEAVKPTERLHIKGSKGGGDMSAKVNGSVKVEMNVKAEENVIADGVVRADNSGADGEVEASSFCYGGSC